MRKAVLRAAMVAVAVVAASAASAEGVSDNTVKIGVLTDMAGVFSDLAGTGAVTAAQMAIDDFVEKEKPPFKVELVSADHQNKPDIATGIARQWYDTGGVDLITDVINSGVALAVSSVAESKSKMLIVTGSGSTRLTNEQCSPYTISYTWDTYSFANGQSRIVKSMGLDTWYFVAVDYALGKSLVAEASDAVTRSGGKIVGTVYHPISTTDLSSFLLQAQGSKAKVIGFANAGADLLNSIKAAKDFNITPGQTIVPLVGTITEVNALGAAATQGMFLVEPFYWDLDDLSRAWSKRFFDKYGKMPNFVQAGAYSAITNYLKAVQAVKTDEAATVIKHLKSTPINDMFARNGKVRADGRMVHDMYLVQVKAPGDVKQKWDYYNVKETIPADEAFQPLSTSKCKMVAQ
ncbi:ABC transporter substrate-binding protein [Bradyrhizobium lablabi]|uniref:ABC transporter substrate-binding protein n=1 Tax=Bradyrhizobium lablabi TaxID=722472 RepID=UPI002012CE09|nr:ABC transporter substrate-binding protein [Bradyrhizobium lablabi]